MAAMRLYLGFIILLQHFYYNDSFLFAPATVAPTKAPSVAPPVAPPVPRPVARPVAQPLGPPVTQSIGPPMEPPYGQYAPYPPQYFPPPGYPQGYPPPMGYPPPPQFPGYPPMAYPPQPPFPGYPPMGYPPQPLPPGYPPQPLPPGYPPQPLPQGYPPPGYPFEPQPQGYPPAGYPGIPGYSGSPGYPPESAEELPKTPPGARKSKKRKQHGKSALIDHKLQFPNVSCPAFFAYQRNESKGWYGYIALPMFSDVDEINLEVNMTINKKVLPEDNLKIKLLSSKDELVRGDYVRWTLKFPYQDIMPRLIQIKYNGHIICFQEPERSEKGTTVTNMWAKSVVEMEKNTDDPLPKYLSYRARPKSENWLQSVLNGLGANFKGYVQTGYQGSYGPVHSEGQAAVDAFASANMDTGVKTGVYGKGGADVGIGEHGVIGEMSGHAESNWNKEGGTVNASVNGNLDKYAPPPLAQKPKVQKAHT